MRELPFYYDKENKKYEYSKPKYIFKIPDKEGEFIDVYQMDYMFNPNGNISENPKFVTSFSKYNLNWENMMKNFSDVFWKIRTEAACTGRFSKYMGSYKYHVDFNTGKLELYAVMSYKEFYKYLLPTVLSEGLFKMLIPTPWLYYFIKSLFEKCEFYEFLNINFSEIVSYPFLKEFIIDDETGLVWIQIDNNTYNRYTYRDEDVAIYENIYKYFKANKIGNIKPKKYDEVFKFNTTVSGKNILETENGNASVYAFTGIKTTTDPNQTIWQYIIEKYKFYMEIVFNKKVDKVYYMPVVDTNCYSVAFKYKK